MSIKLVHETLDTVSSNNNNQNLILLKNFRLSQLPKFLDTSAPGETQAVFLDTLIIYYSDSTYSGVTQNRFFFKYNSVASSSFDHNGTAGTSKLSNKVNNVTNQLYAASPPSIHVIHHVDIGSNSWNIFPTPAIYTHPTYVVPTTPTAEDQILIYAQKLASSADYRWEVFTKIYVYNDGI